MAPEELFLGNLPRIEQLIRSTCRRYRMDDAEVDDFASAAKLKLIEDDYAVLRQYEGKSSLSTYLYIVIQRFYLDYRDHEWGRWRPSAEAKRNGQAAIEFELLTRRDGDSVESACRAVMQRYPAVTRAELERWESLLPVRAPRSRTRDRVEDVAIAAPETAEDRLIEREVTDKARSANEVLRGLFATLSPESQVILRMRFSSGLKVVTIANALGLDAKRLYKTLEGLIAQLRRALADGGVSTKDIGDLLEHGGAGIEIPFFSDTPEILVVAPSQHAAKEGPALQPD